jgi:hypothetical protein
MVGVDDEIELAGNTDRTDHFEGSAGGRQVADGATDATAAEFYRASLKHALSKRNSVLIHRLELDPNLKNSVNYGNRHSNIDDTRLNYPQTEGARRERQAGHERVSTISALPLNASPERSIQSKRENVKFRLDPGAVDQFQASTAVQCMKLSSRP